MRARRTAHQRHNGKVLLKRSASQSLRSRRSCTSKGPSAQLLAKIALEQEARTQEEEDNGKMRSRMQRLGQRVAAAPQQQQWPEACAAGTASGTGAWGVIRVCTGMTSQRQREPFAGSRGHKSVLSHKAVM